MRLKGEGSLLEFDPLVLGSWNWLLLSFFDPSQDTALFSQIENYGCLY